MGLTAWLAEASMLRFAPQFPDRTALALLAGALIGFVPACTRPPTTSQVQPAAAPPTTVRASDLTSGTIEKRPHESIESLLQGRTSGVDVAVYPNGSISVRIHGPSSFYAGNEPLYVIDGSPITPEPGGTLRGINPNDIESIEVLKFPPATSLYGMRGTNGVIVITTTRPRKR
jgi:TonB-dependent SusC/RagA subfamily outer membrane receptor